uniref:Histone H4 n=2 Tax=Scleropages formosus TaxID=113540 RepID=A0A8C9R4I1_SCLFO
MQRTSGRGKSSKGGAMLHRKVLLITFSVLWNRPFDTHGVLKVFLKNTICDAIAYTEQPKRKTATAMDAVYALKCQGGTLYDFGG